MSLAPRLLSPLALCAAFLCLCACSASQDGGKASASSQPRERIAVLKSAPSDAATKEVDLTVLLPEETVNADWAQNGGNAAHAPGHLALTRGPLAKAWSTNIGAGSSGNYKLLCPPIVSGNMLYAQDSQGRVSAYDVKDGDRLWRMETAPEDRSDEAMGGCLAARGEVVYATTGFGEVLALARSDGHILWRRALGKPFRAAPTIADGRLLVTNIENETTLLDGKTGLALWQHKGIAESATLMGSANPAVRGDTVVVAYSSGELFGLRLQNGRVVWGEVLAVPTKIGALPAIADIRGLPVMEGGRVYAISHSGRMAAIDERRGAVAWEADRGGVNTPAVVGNTVYLMTNEGRLLALSRQDGRVIWSVALQTRQDPEDRDSRSVSWFGPVVAGGRLWLTNSLGHLAAFAPETGTLVSEEEIGDSFFLPPIVANRTLYVLDDDGDITALR